MGLVGPVRRMLDGPAARDARMFVRRLGAGRRVLPDFLVIGAQKSGTSSLFRYLDQHPQVRGSVPKEVHYFSGGFAPAPDAYARGEGWYRAHFPKKAAMGQGVRAFEATPLYLLHPLAAGRIHALMPAVKLVAVLRNPTDRALSHYFHNVRNNDLPRLPRGARAGRGDGGGGGAARADPRGGRLPQRDLPGRDLQGARALPRAASPLHRYLPAREPARAPRRGPLRRSGRADGPARRLPRHRPRPRPGRLQADERRPATARRSPTAPARCSTPTSLPTTAPSPKPSAATSAGKDPATPRLPALTGR